MVNLVHEKNRRFWNEEANDQSHGRKNWRVDGDRVPPEDESQRVDD